MDLTGEYHIAASREQVWAALNDPEVLKASIPGCSDLNAVGDDSFTATVTAKVGPVKAKFQGQVTLSDMDPPNGYTIQGEGKGGPAGFAKGGAKVTLVEDGDGTLLRYEVNANVGGKLAQIGSRLIDGTAKKLAGEFFTTFAEIAAASAPNVSAGAAVETAASEDVGRPGAATDVPPAVVDAAASSGEAAPEMLHVRSDDVSSRATKSSADPMAGEDAAGGGLPRWVWITGLILILIAIISVLGGD
ncbi:MAG: carbon monoxide dehydrogenase subunit G [Rhodospirillaceae bacterium]|nr:carbon monoxide dehydrogenase subunit G [Rhodospirillaceae bacterium]MBT4687076.1 carbon monoxide dehydrogenase subunit G [Rhodospirillaceae bacterium]MBT5082592.1 carbon monoxide dehydrogenase subunit G [Rhodospirillaceae bacterium]MBT5526078.1 carbon monoxide dehydrogenase subunit G [Rhodospirillaceae bacterium]MBT5879607.1 carbon monoxide dehydrogenase subunit G [Rhodospirillaceae bacterium]